MVGTYLDPSAWHPLHSRIPLPLCRSPTSRTVHELIRQWMTRVNDIPRIPAPARDSTALGRSTTVDRARTPVRLGTRRPARLPWACGRPRAGVVGRRGGGAHPQERKAGERAGRPTMVQIKLPDGSIKEYPEGVRP